MAHVSIYLNFMGNTEEAFNFYKKVFGTEWSTPPSRMGDMPPHPNAPVLSDAEKNAIMHVALPILGGTEIMGTDMLESMGHELVLGNNITISLNPDTREEADRLYNELSTGGKGTAPHEEFWGYWGACTDKYGIKWMFNITNPTA